ncbi:FecR family protein [Caulobacter mirabilis]|uniref:Iron dicitrate transport regulator FecR n=1 Tax=Caulobacter mirabilis TaxID=69666 RepID=A0A2D2AU63_9CAUL|nr:FecR domain-containing protein [Caulobacter mirabilis]ATQ41507.1 iron dicitrate transport regulator FecR [Caulobacter mirabilis]
MSDASTAREIDEAAADWAVRLDADPARYAAAVETWLAGDPRRAGALLRARAALSFIDAAADGGGVATPRRRGPSRRGLLAGGGLLAAGLAGLTVWRGMGDRYDTGLGEVRRVSLADGSTTTINTQSAVGVSLEPEVRRVRLARGEAWFRVAKDATRPFVVEAGNARVRAVGTAFSVRRRDDGVEVLVTEGVVEVWRAGAEVSRSRVAAGEKAYVYEEQPAQAVRAAPNEIEDALAWRQGQIVLTGTTLAEAASEFNRYNHRKLVIDEPDLAGETLVGRFRADEPDSFARAAASTLGAAVREDGGTIHLSRKRLY